MLTVNLSEQIAAVQGEELKRALAQIVWTATSRPGIDRVRFQVKGTTSGGHHRRGDGHRPGEPGRLPVAASPSVETTTTRHP